jgi:hypothetical protein
MRLALLVLTFVVAAGPLGAQPTPPPPPSDPIHDLFAGRWQGDGTILGQPARAELTVERVLDGRFTRLLWVSHLGLPPRTQRFEGHAYYARPSADGHYSATWFDSSGAVRPIRAGPDGSTVVIGSNGRGAVVAHWGTPETEQGETTYRRVEPDALEVVDRVLGKNGEWREFGRTRLTRVP